jgi:hypothetical protein
MRNVLGVLVPILIIFTFLKTYNKLWSFIPESIQKRYWSQIIVLSCLIVVIISVLSMVFIYI